jgi:hypothetical protein
MHTLAVLKYCREVLAERRQRDDWHAWFWSIRCKVIDYWIARLEHDSDAECSSELSPEDKQIIRRSHPLLTSRQPIAGTVLDIDRQWQTALRERVERFMEAVRSHR